MASVSTSSTIDSEPEDQDFTDANSEEEREDHAEGIDAPFSQWSMFWISTNLKPGRP